MFKEPIFSIVSDFSPYPSPDNRVTLTAASVRYPDPKRKEFGGVVYRVADLQGNILGQIHIEREGSREFFAVYDNATSEAISDCWTLKDAISWLIK
jgi:hypothetical protein